VRRNRPARRVTEIRSSLYENHCGDSQEIMNHVTV
jgi:hypothetical protein